MRLELPEGLGLAHGDGGARAAGRGVVEIVEILARVRGRGRGRGRGRVRVRI